MFNKQPTGFEFKENVISKWNKLGPIDVKKMISKYNIQVDYGKEIKYDGKRKNIDGQ